MNSDVTPAQIAQLSGSILTREKFAETVGLTASTVFSMCDRGYLPILHLGRRVFINLEVLRRECAAKEFSL